MPGITRADIAAFRTHGYVVVPGALDDGQLSSRRATAGTMLAAQPPPAGQAGPYFLWPRFESGDGSGLLAFYHQSGIAQLAAALLRAGHPSAVRHVPGRAWRGCACPAAP